MKKNLILWGAVLIFILISVYVSRNHSISSPDALPNAQVVQAQNANGSDVAVQEEIVANVSDTREQAIDFTLTDLDGNEVKLSDYRGTNVYINFWATWCKWCKKEMPDIEKIYQAHQGGDLVVLALSVGEDRDKVSSYIEEHGYPFKVLLDPDKSVALKYDIKPIPVSIFVDKEGYIAYRKLGAMTEAEMIAVIEGLA
jgi:peroxiredoxin